MSTQMSEVDNLMPRSAGDPIVFRITNETINDLVRGKEISWSILVGDLYQIVTWRPTLGGRLVSYEELRRLELAAQDRSMYENPPYVKEMEGREWMSQWKDWRRIRPVTVMFRPVNF